MGSNNTDAYIVAARRSALGRIGGLHRARRLEDLAAPVIAAALADARIEAARVEELVLGNTTAGANPARLVALASGLPETASALTIDRHCASGLDAILLGLRSVRGGHADIVIAGGAESLSTAPWRIARPKGSHQVPHFIGHDGNGGSETGLPAQLEALEALALSGNLGKPLQDAYAYKTHLRAMRARDGRRLVGEIVPLRGLAEEARDQSATEPDLADIEATAPFLPDGTLSAATTSAMHDGAAFAVVVSERVWTELGKPPALRLLAGTACGVPHGDAPLASLMAMKRLARRREADGKPLALDRLGAVEVGEGSAVEAMLFVSQLGLDDDAVNADGGAIVRGQSLGATGAVLVARLFTRLVRAGGGKAPREGAVALGALGGLGVAALFQRT